MSVFHAYDIRGRYGDTLTDALVYRVGRHLPGLLPAQRMAIGRDARLSSPALREALCRGLSESGCDVLDLGLTTTPMVTFATHHFQLQGSVQITASHNPPEDNGLKIARGDLLPVGADSGMDELARRVRQTELPARAARPGVVRSADARAPFLAFLNPWRPDLSGLRLAIDGSNGMVGRLMPELLGDADLRLYNLTPDGRFPAHSPNPLDPQAQAQLAEAVRREQCDAGLLFDGDADRVAFFDAEGRFIRPDLMIGPLAEAVLRREPGADILCDIRTSQGVIDGIVQRGGHCHLGRVGHAFAKPRMRALNAALGGELAAHYYFRDFFGCDSGELAALRVLAELTRAKTGKRTLADLVAPFEAGYHNTGEWNLRLADKAGALTALRAALIAAEPLRHELDFDGYRLEFDDGWVNLRLSNTEPYLRLIAEARNPRRLAERLQRIKRVLRDFETVNG